MKGYEDQFNIQYSALFTNTLSLYNGGKDLVRKAISKICILYNATFLIVGLHLDFSIYSRRFISLKS